MHSAGKRGERTQTLEGVLLEAALSFFLGRGKIKFHQHAESQLIFPNPKTADIHHKRAKTKQNETHKRNINSVAHITVQENLPRKDIYIYIHLSIYIYKQRSRQNSANNRSVAKMISVDEKDGSNMQVTRFQSKKFSALFLLLRRWGIHAARFRG